MRFKVDMKVYLPVISSLLILIFIGCFSNAKLARQNIADLYLPQNKLKQSIVEFEVINQGKSIELLFNLNTINIKASNFKAKLTLNLYNNVKTVTPLREIVQPIEFNNFKATFAFDIFDAYDLISYKIEATNLKESITGFLKIDELNNNDLIITNNTKPNKASYLIKNEIINFKVENVLVKYFDTSNYIALAPYITNPKRLIAKPAITAETTLKETIFAPQQNGYYLFENDEKYKGILCVGEDFPEINDLKNYALTLRYITKNEELLKILANENLETAIDSFWLSIGNNYERANRIKQEYLLRITTSNTYFSSFLAGWQTDRGMIYTTFGTPNEVYKTEEGENWYYTNDQIQFKFIKKIVLANYNHYQLQRSENLALYWHRAVNKWRNGHIKSTVIVK